MGIMPTNLVSQADESESGMKSTKAQNHSEMMTGENLVGMGIDAMNYIAELKFN